MDEHIEAAAEAMGLPDQLKILGVHRETAQRAIQAWLRSIDLTTQNAAVVGPAGTDQGRTLVLLNAIHEIEAFAPYVPNFLEERS